MPPINYPELKDDVEKLKQTAEKFFHCVDALSQVGDLEQMIQGRVNEYNAKAAEVTQAQTKLEAIRKTQEAEAADHDAKITAARGEADRIVAAAKTEARRLSQEAADARDAATVEAGTAMEAQADNHRAAIRALLNRQAEVEAELAKVTDELLAKKAEVDAARAAHADVQAQMEGVRKAAQAVLSKE